MEAEEDTKTDVVKGDRGSTYEKLLMAGLRVLGKKGRREARKKAQKQLRP